MDKLKFVFLKNRDLIPSYLSSPENNKYDTLLKLFQQFEKENGPLDIGIFNTRKPIIGKLSFFELPTNETINVIKKICEYFNSNELLDLGAGCGLFSAVINQSKIGLKFNPSDPVSFEFCDLMGTFCPIERKSFSDIKSDQPIFIGWLHSSCQVDFIKMVTSNKPKFIIHLGEGPNCACYDGTFLPKMKSLGYN